MAYIDEDKIWCYRGFVIEAIIADLRAQEKALQTKEARAKLVRDYIQNLYDNAKEGQREGESKGEKSALNRMDYCEGATINLVLVMAALDNPEMPLTFFVPATPKAPEGTKA